MYNQPPREIISGDAQEIALLESPPTTKCKSLRKLQLGESIEF